MSEKAMLPDSKICAVCGKEFTVLFPELWRFFKYNEKMGKRWMCSWKCLRQYEEKKKETKKAAKEQAEIRKQLEEEADELADIKHRDQGNVIRGVLEAFEKGENHMEYLKKIGYKNPSDQMKKLRRWAEKNDEGLAKRMEAVPEPKRGAPKGTKPAQGGLVLIPVEKKGQMVNVVKKLPEEAKKPEKKAEEQQKKGRFTVTNIESRETTARYSFFKDIDVFTLKLGMDQISLSPADWKKLLAEIPEAMQTLGVNV